MAEYEFLEIGDISYLKDSPKEEKLFQIKNILKFFHNYNSFIFDQDISVRLDDNFFGQVYIYKQHFL